MPLGHIIFLWKGWSCKTLRRLIINFAINRDTGDVSLSRIYIRLKDSTNIFHLSNSTQPLRISNQIRGCRQEKSIVKQRIYVQSN